MVEILSDPIWQGISGVVAIISLTFYILIERGKLPKFSVNFSSLRSFFAVLFFLALFILLFEAIDLVIDAVRKEYGNIFGNLISELIYGLGVWLAFTAIVFVFPGDFNHPIAYVKMVSLLILIELVINAFFAVVSADSTPQDEIFEFWRGMFWGGFVVYFAISWMNFKYLKKD